MKKSMNILKEISASIKAINAKSKFTIVNITQLENNLTFETFGSTLGDIPFIASYTIGNRSTDTFQFALDDKLDKFAKACTNIGDGFFTSDGKLTNNKRSASFKIKDYKALNLFNIPADTKSIEIENLHEKYDKVKRFVNTTENYRPILNTIHIKDGFMVGIDGYRVAKVKAYDSIDNGLVGNIPFEVLKYASEWTKKLNVKATIEYTNENYRVTIVNSEISVTLTGKLNTGEYFNYSKLLNNNEIVGQFEVNVKDFKEEVKFLKDMKDKDSKMPLILDIASENKEVKLSIDDSFSKVKIDDVNYSPSAVNRIAFNENFIIDLLDSVDNDTILLQMPDSSIKPIIATDKDDNTFLVLPVKIK